jgi:hypothetical protein
MPDVNLNPDGPHSPDRTAEAAALFDACSRFLVYATLGSAPGLEYPSEAYRLLGELYSATGRLPQLCAQLTAFLAAAKDSGTLREASGADVSERVAAAAYHLGLAHGAASDLTSALQDAQADISGLGVKETGVVFDRPIRPCPNTPPCEHPESAHDPGAGSPGSPPWCLDCDCGGEPDDEDDLPPKEDGDG